MGEARDAADQHLDRCAHCQVLLALAVQGGAATQEAASPGSLNLLSEEALVAERYRVLRFVARGGMGEVYEAHDQLLDERVALKTLTASALDNPKAILRLRSEVRLARRISHPHACRIHDFGTQPLPGSATLPLCFLTMEYLEGVTLGARIRRQGKLPTRDVLPVGGQLLDALSAAHQVGILHRDFKSDNVMLRSPPRGESALDAVVMDFGLARIVNPGSVRLTSYTQALLGSAAYMAPEQVEGADLSPACDIYAFGVVLFEMLTGQLPFWAGSPIPTALQRLHKPPPKPSSVAPELGPQWDALVLGCLQRRVTQRYQTAREVRAALDAIADKAACAGRLRTRPRVALWLSGFVAGSATTIGLAGTGSLDPPCSPVVTRSSLSCQAEASFKEERPSTSHVPIRGPVPSPKGGDAQLSAKPGVSMGSRPRTASRHTPPTEPATDLASPRTHAPPARPRPPNSRKDEPSRAQAASGPSDRFVDPLADERVPTELTSRPSSHPIEGFFDPRDRPVGLLRSAP